MSYPVVVLLSCLLPLSPVSAFNDFDSIRNHFFDEVANLKGIKETIQDSMPDSPEALIAVAQMIDASSVIPNGILSGHAVQLGNFDECYNIQYEEIYGKYCLGTLPLNVILEFFNTFGLHNDTQIIQPQPRIIGLGVENLGLNFAFCMPSNLSVTDLSGPITFTEEFCYTKANNSELSAGAIVTIVILSIFLVAIVASTGFDIFLCYRNQESPHELLIAFSFLTNGRKLFQSSSNPDQLLCLNGIKVLSMLWVIIGHEYFLALNASMSNLFDVTDWQNRSENMFIMGATVSVDTFLVVGGLVTVYTFLKAVDKGVKFNIILYYIHRYLRLTPVLIIIVLFHLFLLNKVGTGPLWKMVDLTLVKQCEDSWWSTLLYIANYVQKGNCPPQTWYLSVDMQLFVLSPIILLPLTKWPKRTLQAVTLLILIGCVVPFAVGYSEHLGTLLTQRNNAQFMSDYYTQTYTRFGPYVIGMLLGYFLYKIKKSDIEVRLSMAQVCSLWLICLTGLTACVYSGYPLIVATEEDRWGDSMFSAFDRPAWAVAVSGIIFLCVAGYGGPVDKLLSLPIFQFLSKLSYCMYLVHYTIIVSRYAVMRNSMWFSNLTLMHVFWGDFMFTLALSLVLCLAFESPIIILERYIFGRGPLRESAKTPKV